MIHDRPVRKNNPGHGDHALWGAVVTQALEDVANAPAGSFVYGEAVAFFTRRGEWGEGRTNVADAIGVHADDLERSGRRIIALREREAGHIGGGLRARRDFIEQQLAKVRNAK